MILEVSPRRRIRNRWLVAYTLIRNPSLQELTASNLSATSEAEEEEAHREGEEENVKVDEETTIQVNDV